jgi:hypothetical protein
MTTTVPAVKAALVALLAGVLPDVEVIYGPITTETMTTPRVLTVGNAAGTSALDSLTTGTSLEQYTVTLTVSCTINGPDTQKAATEAACAVFAVAEQTIREHPTGDLGLSASGVLGAFPTGDFEVTEADTDLGSNAAVKWSVYVQAQRT